MSSDVLSYLTSLIRHLLGEPQASLLIGILFGSQTKLPADLIYALKVTGTLHMVAVSGQNMSILAGYLGKLSYLMGRKIALVFQAAAILGYMYLVGGGASVLRSGLMALIVLLAVALGRQGDGGRALLVVGVGMIIIHPAFLTDIGFQLSTAATAGIIWLEPVINSKLRVLPEFLRNSLSVSLAAQAFTWPIIIFNFGIVSVFSIPANLVLEWVVPWIMSLGALTLLLAWIWLPLGQLIAFIVWVPLTYFVEVVNFIAMLPGASFEWREFPIGLGVIYYSLLIGVIIRWPVRKIS